jgi:two-component system, chemotaxis family, chemotaxis protein CheY
VTLGVTPGLPALEPTVSFVSMARPTNALIVDDEAHVRVFVRLLLKEAGVERTWEAADGAKGLELVEEHRPELVLLDINMPIMDGLTMLGELAERHPEVPVIMLSSLGSAKIVKECVERGAVGYILKHSSRAAAVATLRETLDNLALDDSAAPDDDDDAAGASESAPGASAS